MQFPPVMTKKDFVRRYSAGEFGNASPTWQGYKEWSQDRNHGPGPFHIRNRITGAKTWYDVSADDVETQWEICCVDYDPKLLYISAMAPTELTLINGEAMQTERGLDLFYSDVKKPMRDALRERSYHVTGIMAVSILRYYMNVLSYDWLQALLDRYQFHVVEFSCYDCEWGTLPRYNTVFWEVRYGY